MKRLISMLMACLHVLWILGGVAHAHEDLGGVGGGPEGNTEVIYLGGDGPGQCSDQGTPNYWIHSSDRSLYITDTELSYQGLGPAIRMTRTYNGLDQRFAAPSGMFGKHWNFAYESTVEGCQGGSTGYLFKGSGKGTSYTPNQCPSATVEPPVELTLSGSYDRLTWYGDYWLLVEHNTHLTYRYDKVGDTAKGRLTSIKDPNGNEVQVNYNADGTIASIKDAAGRQTKFAYNARKLCTTMTAPDGQKAVFKYDAAGNLIQTIDRAGIVSIYEYNTDGFVSQMTTEGKTTVFTYSGFLGKGKVSSVKDARGNTTLYEVEDPWYGGTKVTDPQGGVTYYRGTGCCSSYKKDALGNLFRWTCFQCTTTGYTDPAGYSVNFQYDARGNLTKRYQNDPVTWDWIMTTYSYDDEDNLISTTNPLGETWTFAYDDHRNMTKATSPLGLGSSFSYNGKGQLASVTNPAGKSISYAYDSFGNVKTVTDPLGKKTTLAYDKFGFSLKSVQDPRKKTTKYSYDKNGRMTQVTHPDGSSRQISYDCCAAGTFKDENGGITKLTRDPLLNITKRISPLGEATEMTYDDAGNLLSLTDPLGNKTLQTFDAAARITGSENPAGKKLEFAHDANGNLISIKDERSKETVFAYNFDNRLVSLTDPLGNSVNFERDYLGRVTTLTSARGGQVTNTYDADGRIVGKTYDGSIGVAAYSYDGAGNLKDVNDISGTTSYTYNAANRVTKIVYPGGLQVSMGYDAAGNLTSVTYPGGLKVTYSYNSRNRIAKASWKGQSISYVYDKAGNLLEETRSNGTRSTYDYDGNNRMIRIRHLKGMETIADLTYTRDAVGNTVETGGVFPLSPTLSAAATAGVYNGENQIITWGSDPYSYDADGNLIQIKDAATFAAVYDNENRPMEITRSGVTASHVYNGIGNRVMSTRGEEVKKYFHDDLGRLLFETDGNNKLLRWYIHAGKRVAATGTPGSGFHFYHFDQLGSTIALTNAAGAVSAAYAYQPFGAVANQTGTVANPFTYVGAFGVMDEGGGLFFMKNRYYDAHTGRFIQKDPIGMAGGVNLYAYVGNNPVDRIDPEGFLFEGWLSIEEQIYLTYLRNRYRFDPTTERWVRIFMKDPELKGDYRGQIRLLKEGIDVLKRAHSKKPEERDIEEKMALCKYGDPRWVGVFEHTLHTVRDMVSNLDPPDNDLHIPWWARWGQTTLGW